MLCADALLFGLLYALLYAHVHIFCLQVFSLQQCQQVESGSDQLSW